jgi:cysteine desulfurase family protein (TIGR01976 family)
MSLAARFPGIGGDGWARFDGPAGTQMVDDAIEAMRAEMSGGSSANVGGTFAASAATDDLVADARATVGRFLGADPAGIVFGANMTTLTLAFTRAIARTFDAGDEIVCTTLDHDANVTPWVLAAADSGARVVMADMDPASGRLPVDAVTARIAAGRTKWVAVTGASNVIGTIPDMAGIVAAAHAAGARVYVDAVHLAPHRRIDVSATGCDALVCSPYKWYGPHAGVLCLQPDLLESLVAYKVRPAPDAGPGKLETGTPSFEAIAGTRAAAQFLLDEDMGAIAAAEATVFRPLLDGLLERDGVTVHGPTGPEDRTPTVLFSVAGHKPVEVAAQLADARVAVWSGHNYAVETIKALGLEAAGGAVRAGVSCYTTPDDVARLLSALPPARSGAD